MASKVDFEIPDNQSVQQFIKDINYSQEMQINKNDVLFIGLITGLQIIRQWLNKAKILDRQRLNDQDAADVVKHNEFMKKIEKNGTGRVVWILGPTSYDAIKRSSDYFNKPGVSGVNHRYATLAHDPLVGLLVGPVNLLSNTITYNTKVKLGTSNVLPNDPNNPGTGYSISRPSSFVSAVGKSADVIRYNKWALSDAIIKHLLHLASDIGTEQGLVIPGLSLLPNINGIQGSQINAWLLKNKFDTVWFADIFAQFGFAEIINTISSIMYKFLLYRDSTKSQEFINAKCQKVLAIANAIASTEDIVVAVIRSMSGDAVGALRELDWGGLLATIKRVIQSDEFKNEIKSLIHVWDNLKFNAQYSAADIETGFLTNIQTVDSKYRVIMKKIHQEYLYYADAETRSADMNLSGSKMFDSSIEFSDLNKVEDTLRSKDHIDDFFVN